MLLARAGWLARRLLYNHIHLLQLAFLIYIDSLFRLHHSLILATSSLKRSRSRIIVEAKIVKFILSEQLKMLFMVQGK